VCSLDRRSADTAWLPTPFSHAFGNITSERPLRPLLSMDASRYFLGVASTPPLQGFTASRSSQATLQECISKSFSMSDHPVCAASVASRHFLTGAATSPLLTGAATSPPWGGDYSPHSHSLEISAGSGVGILKRLEYMSKEFRKWLVHDRYGRARKHDRKGTWRSAESQSWRTFPWSRGEIQRLEQSGLSKISAGDASAGLTTPPDHKPR
jgi:hypothetical protein